MTTIREMFSYLLDDLSNDEFEFSEVDQYGATILVSKVGGGTLGRSYEGAWLYRVLANGKTVQEGIFDDRGLRSHAYVALLVSRFSQGD